MARVLHKLTRTGDSYQVIIPIMVARRWMQEGIVAVQVEWVPPSLVLTPVTLKGLEHLKGFGHREEDPSAGYRPKR